MVPLSTAKASKSVKRQFANTLPTMTWAAATGQAGMFTNTGKLLVAYPTTEDIGRLEVNIAHIKKHRRFGGAFSVLRNIENYGNILNDCRAMHTI